MSLMTTLFISDLHLSPENPELIQLTIEFLKTETKGIEALYILGDLFNTWLGDDIVPSEYEPLITQLQQLHQSGIKTYLMVGNRDFMLGKEFAGRAACTLLNDPVVIRLNGIDTLLMHGDSLCTDDVSYQRYRRWIRNKFLQWCFLHLPASYRQRISDKIKQKSRDQKQSKSAMIMDVNPTEVNRVITSFGVTRLIHGHTHRPAIHNINMGSKEAHRVVLGDWDGTISYLRCDDQQLQLVDHRASQQSSILMNRPLIQ
ncbi:MAG: UDP-2,3-diacylglucosamine diphosphatase [Gammaproteobacteria bacterium]|nr:UDP-2,3-diacylglucosamine diphosphatase [Gammaproteobacteria bacterium]